MFEDMAYGDIIQLERWDGHMPTCDSHADG